MKYPKFLSDNNTIGILATSCGSNVNPYRIRTQQAIKNMEDKETTIDISGLNEKQKKIVARL